MSHAPGVQPPVPLKTLRITSTGGVTLHAELHGNPWARTLVLVHGWTASTKVWGGVIRALGERARVVVYDQRGHGESDTPARDGYSTTALVDDLSAVLGVTVATGDRAILVGHSMGGITVMAAGRRSAVVERTAGVVLASTGARGLAAAARVVPVPWNPVSGLAHRILLVTDVPLGPRNPLTEAVFAYAALAPSSPRHLVELNAQMVHSCGRLQRARWGRVLASVDVTAELAGWTVPVRILAGSADRMTPPSLSYQLATLLPDCAGVTELVGVGHMTPLEVPGAIADMSMSLVGRQGAGVAASGV